MAASKPNLDELAEKLPATDREVQAAQKAAASAAGSEKKDAAEPAKPVRRPDRDGQGSKFTGPDPEEADRLCAQVLAGGRDSLSELIGMIRDPGDPEFKNYKAEYLLHCLTIHVGRPGQAAPRRLFIDTLVAQLGNTRLSKYVRGFLVRELHTIGDKAAVPALGKLLEDEQLCADATAALVAIGEGAAEQLRKALPAARGNCRLLLVQNLGVVRDAKSSPDLLKALRDESRDLRLAAAWGLARIGEPSAVEPLLKAADVESTLERVKATQACLLLAETLLAAGKKSQATAIYTHLRTTRTDPKEAYVREAATKALEALGGKLT